jgi:tetratricopeptide (TPR) repeat protein
MGGIFARYHRGELTWDEVQGLFADDEASPLFRLKERCHALFRAGTAATDLARHREVLFDLAVGSLFHEAMKFRESFYQREVYGPRVRALREEAGEQAAALFQEFEKILATVSERLEEGLLETEALLARSREQLVVLMAQHPKNGHLARFLIERRDNAEAVFVQGLDALLTELYGDPAAGFDLAGRSYLESGYFDEAEGALAEALEPPRAYARGMAAYLRGDYAATVEELASWADSEPDPEAPMVELAAGAVARLDQLAEGPDRKRIVSAAAALSARLAQWRVGDPAVAP